MSLSSRVATLEDLNAIKRVQHQYAYRLDAGDWEGVAALFLPDGSLEVGLDGVFQGREAIARYLSEAWGPTPSPALTAAHLQLMPVISLDADRRTARATWRELGTGGGPGVEAYWAEGPQENTYEKVGDAWFIASLNWRRALHVPFRGGWAAHRDQSPNVATAGAPSTNDYEPWPGVDTPTFHFETPELLKSAGRPGIADEPESLATIEGLPARIAALEAVRAVENLQALLGFCFDKALWDPLSTLLAPDCVVATNGHTVTGRAAVRAVLDRIAKQGPEYGRLQDVMHLQPLITVAPDGRSATGRWRLFAQLARHGEYHEFALALADVDYVRRGDDWLVTTISITDPRVTSYDEGWDLDLRDAPTLVAGIAPHESDAEADPRLGAADGEATPRGASSDGEDVELRLSRLEAAQDIERLQNIYGYYLATFKWDEMVELFDIDGTMEVALRGVYRGGASIRKCLDLFGTAPEWGVLHNHMQLQQMIDVAPDGTSARLRARAFSMMGPYQGLTRWMGGIYENEFVRRDGRWLFAKDQVYNTYFATYEDGWKRVVPRRPPLVSETTPPDEPPTVDFDMFPEPHLPAFEFERLQGFNLY